MVSATMSWLSSTSNHNATTHHHHHHHHFLHIPRFWHVHKSPSHPDTLEILSFEAAKTMCRLISLHMFLSDEELSKFRHGPLVSKGVIYLNSQKEKCLLNLACAEKLEELNAAAYFVSRLGQKCSDPELRNFGQVFTNLKQGIVDAEKVEVNKKNVEKLIQKMAKYVSATYHLYLATESLSEMELSERKLKLWKGNIAPKLPNNLSCEHLEEKITFQRALVKHYRENSLWSETFDKTAGLLARIICVIYARVCEVFSPYVPDLPHFSINTVRHILHPKSQHMKIHPELDYCLLSDKNKYTRQRTGRSTSFPKTSVNKLISKIFHHECGANNCLISDKDKHSQPMNHNSSSKTPESSPKASINHFVASPIPKNNRKLIDSAVPSTVGGAGLANRYANIIILAEKFCSSPIDVSNESRARMYELLPESMKCSIRTRLLNLEKPEVHGFEAAERWRNSVEEILSLLVPLAHDTVQWYTERSLEKQKFDIRPTTLLLQTLHFSDKEKTEAAIVELLAGLTCVCRHQRRVSLSRKGSIR